MSFLNPGPTKSCRPPTSSSPWDVATPARSSPASGMRTGKCPTPPVNPWMQFDPSAMTSKNGSAACSPTSESPHAGTTALMNLPMAPSVLFVCVKNSGKSQMAAALMRKLAGDSVHVYSAGTQPGNGINKLSAESLAEVGVDISDETPKPIDRKLLREVDFIITLGREADLEPVSGASYERWDTDEPSER